MITEKPIVRYWDASTERATPQELETLQLARLTALIEQCLSANDFHRQRLVCAGISSGSFTSLKQLEELPLMSKSDVLSSMASKPPFGDILGISQGDIREVVMSSGTTNRVREAVALSAVDLSNAAEVAAMDQYWKGGSAGDRAMYCVNLGVTTGPTIIVAGWQRMGMVPLRAGPYSTEERVELFARYRPSVLQLSRTYAPRFIDACIQMNINPKVDVPNLVAVRTAGASYGQSFVEEIEDFFGVPLHETYGATQSAHPMAGTCEHAFNTPLQERLLHFHEHSIIIEILDPSTRVPVEVGEIGEVVLTTISRVGSPLIRYATGDLVRTMPNQCPCGRNFKTIQAGSISRVDDMLRIKNTNVWLHELETVIISTEWIREFDLDLYIDSAGRERAQLNVEPKTSAVIDSPQVSQLVELLRATFHVGFDVEIVPPGSVEHEMQKSRRCTDRRNR